MIFKIDSQYLQDPAHTKPVIKVQHDSFTGQKPWIKNSTFEGGQGRPIYELKYGLSMDSTPRPYMEDVEEITPFTIFHKGDKAPYVVGLKGVRWGGSKDDILAKGEWGNNTWTVEMGRALDTGHDDDIKLDPKSGKTYTFVIVVRDGGKGYAISSPVSLKLGK